MDIGTLASQLGIELGARAITSIVNKLSRVKKTPTDKDKIEAIKAYTKVKKPNMREVAGEMKHGGKAYSKGGGVRTARYKD